MICVMVERTASAISSDVKMDTAAVQEKIERIKTLRQQLGWSEEVCAYHLGVTYSTLNRWERGESFPASRVMLKAIDDFLAKYGKARKERG